MRGGKHCPGMGSKQSHWGGRCKVQARGGKALSEAETEKDKGLGNRSYAGREEKERVKNNFQIWDLNTGERKASQWINENSGKRLDSRRK